MWAYFRSAAIMNILVDFLLLVATNRLFGYPSGWRRSGAAAVFGGAYAAVCMIERFSFLGSMLWRIVFLGLMGWIAFGFYRSSVRRMVIFILLCTAMGGVAQGINAGGTVSGILSAVVIFALCVIGFRDIPGKAKYVPVELTYGEKRISILALQDTGNTLRDPITGRPVLVVEAGVAQKLTGLTPEQLRSPIKALEERAVPGLRLIPYRSVGQNAGMLLALSFRDVRIGKWKGSSLVAFAPEDLCDDGQYQALTGGAA